MPARLLVPIFALDERHLFPDPVLSEDSGLLAVGGDLHPRRVLLGYTLGIFPWYSEGQPILWHSPDPRFVLFPEELHLGRSLRKRLRQEPYRITLDEAFEDVILACAAAPRPDQEGTWITDEMAESYLRLHRAGFAHSVEAWRDQQLVGGLYGVSLGSIFFGESMFSRAQDASKIAFVRFVQQLRKWGFELLDSQVYTDHLARFGGKEISRATYLEILRRCLESPTRRGAWAFDDDDAH